MVHKSLLTCVYLRQPFEMLTILSVHNQCLVNYCEHIKEISKKGFFLLQETHFEDNDKDILRHEWGTKDFFLNNGERNSRGTAIFISNVNSKNYSIFRTMFTFTASFNGTS